MINKNSRIYIAGHNGMVGSSLVRLFKKKKFYNLILRSKKQLNLLNQKKTYDFLKNNNIDAVIIAAAKVGGINANNTYRGQFLFENLQIQNNLIHGSYLAGIKKLIFLGSSCIYPKFSKQPIKEEYLLTGALEQTNEPYAIAKISGIKMIENYNNQYGTNFLCLMPCNLYGPNDNYDQNNSHFFPALLKKIHFAKTNKNKSFIIWGDGKAKRELMHVDDLANACYLFLRSKKTNEVLINVGSGFELSIKQYAEQIMNILKCKLKIQYDLNKENGTPRKLIDSTKAYKYGWRPKISLKKGIEQTYSEFIRKNFHV